MPKRMDESYARLPGSMTWMGTRLSSGSLRRQRRKDFYCKLAVTWASGGPLRSRTQIRGSRLLVWSAWFAMIMPGFCSSFSGVALTDGRVPVSGATVLWNNQRVCVSSPPHGMLVCSPPTVQGSTKTQSDGSFIASNIPPDLYSIHVQPAAGDLILSSDQWPVPGSALSVQLANNEDRTGMQVILQTASLVVIHVKDPMNAIQKTFFRPGVMFGTGGYFSASYDPKRGAYTTLIAKGTQAQLYFDTLLVVQDGNGASLPIDTAVWPFTAKDDEVLLSFSVVPALVNAASYLPGIAEGVIAALFGSGFSDTPGIQLATGFPLPTQLSGTSVKVNGVTAPLLAVIEQDGHAQLNFQVPHLPGFRSQVEVVVNNNGKEQTFHVRASIQLGIFGSLAHANGEAIISTNPARPEEQITIYWTGISGYNFDYSPGVYYAPDGLASPSAPCLYYLAPEVRIGGIPAEVNSCSAAPGLAGIGQIVVTVPTGLSSGDHDVEITMGSGGKGNIVTVAVQI